MKHTVVLGFLIFLTLSASTQVYVSRAIALLPAVSSPSQDVFYINKHFGFRFVQPSDYVIVNTTENLSNKPDAPLQAWQIWKQADYSQRIYLPESPPIISITIYNNPRRLPLENWKQLSRNDQRTTSVARQQAIAYTATGLYESDNVLFSSSDGRYVFHIKGDYLDTNDPIRQTFQNILSSFNLIR